MFQGEKLVFLHQKHVFLGRKHMFLHWKHKTSPLAERKIPAILTFCLPLLFLIYVKKLTRFRNKWGMVVFRYVIFYV